MSVESFIIDAFGNRGGEYTDTRPCSWCGVEVVGWPAWLSDRAPVLVSQLGMCDACNKKSRREDIDRYLRAEDQDRWTRARKPLDGIADVVLNPVLRRWLEGEKRKFLCLHGPSGHGKTTQIKSLIREFIARMHRSAVYRTEGEIYDGLMDFNDNTRRLRETEAVLNCGLLVIDDVGTSHSTDARADVLFKVIDARYRHSGRTVILTNLDASDHGDFWEQKHIDERIRRRIYDMCGKPIHVEKMWSETPEHQRPEHARGAK